MAEIYTISLKDEVSAAAARAEAATRALDRAIIQTSAALRGGDAAALNMARGVERLASSERRAAIASLRLVAPKTGALAQIRAFASTQGMGALGGVLGPFAGLIAGAGASIAPLTAVALGLAGIVAVGAAVVSTAAKIGEFKARLKGTGDTAAEAETDLERIRTIALKIGEDFDTVAESFINFKKQGFTSSDAEGLVRLGLDLKEVSNDAAQANGALELLTKAAIGGKLRANAFTELQKAGLPAIAALQNLATQMGISEAELTKRFAAGTAPVARYVTELEKLFLASHGAKGLGDTADALGALTMKGNLEDIKAVIESGILVPLGQRAEPILLKLSQRAAEFAKSFQPAALDFFISQLNRVDAILSGSLTDKLTALPRLVFGAIGDGIAAGLEFAFGDKWFEIGSQIVDGLAAGTKAGASRAVNAVKELGNDLVIGTENLLGIESPSKVFAKQGKEIDAGLAVGIEDHADLAFSAASDMAEGAVDGGLAGARGGGVPSARALDALASTAVGAAGATDNSSARALTVGPFTINLGALGGEADAGGSAAESIRAYFETEFVALLERSLEGSGA